MSEGKLASQLASMAHRTDLPDSSRFPMPPITSLISFYLGSPELRGRLQSVILENVVKGVLWDSQMQADVTDASKLIEGSIARSMAGMSVKEFFPSGHAIGIRVANKV